MNLIARLCCGCILWLLAAGGAPAAEYETAAIYDGLRTRLFELTPAALGLPDGDRRVLAVLMETPFPDAVVTLVATADGSTSLYFSNGGGRIGIGVFEAVRVEATQLLAVGETARKMMAPAIGRPLPAAGMIRFYIMAAGIALSAEAPEAELLSGTHVLSPLFEQANRVLTAIRAVEGEQAAGQSPQ